MLGEHFDSYLTCAGTPYKTMEEAEDRLKRVQRDFPEMKGHVYKASNKITWYYEPKKIAEGQYVVEVSYTKHN